MNRRELLASAIGVVCTALIPLPVTKAIESLSPKPYEINIHIERFVVKAIYGAAGSYVGYQMTWYGTLNGREVQGEKLVGTLDTESDYMMFELTKQGDELVALGISKDSLPTNG